MTRASGRVPAVGEAILSAVDKVVVHRWPQAIATAQAATGTREQRIAKVRSSFTRELAMAGAAAGATAAVPGVGTVGAVGAGAAELGWFTLRAGDLILAVAAVHGHTEASVEQRRAWVLSILAFGDTAAAGFTKVAGEVGKGLGKKTTARIPAETLRQINRALGRTVITKYGTKRGAIALGRVLPFGIGAAIGGTANAVLVRSISRQADAFFVHLADAGASEDPTDVPATYVREPDVVEDDPDLAVIVDEPMMVEIDVAGDDGPVLTAPIVVFSGDVHGRMANDAFRRDAEAGVHDHPVGPVNALVDDLRKGERGWVPYVAPTYGGVEAEVLLLFRDPGPMTNPQLKGSGFLSVENDDDSARRLGWLLDTVGIDQARCVGWNAYPWYINRKPGAGELEVGVPALRDLLNLLPRLKVVLLCGKDAQDSWKRLGRRYPLVAHGMSAIETYHTSNQAFFVSEPEQTARKWRQLFHFAEAAALIEQSTESSSGTG